MARPRHSRMGHGKTWRKGDGHAAAEKTEGLAWRRRRAIRHHEGRRRGRASGDRRTHRRRRGAGARPAGRTRPRRGEGRGHPYRPQSRRACPTRARSRNREDAGRIRPETDVVGAVPAGRPGHARRVGAPPPGRGDAPLVRPDPFPRPNGWATGISPRSPNTPARTAWTRMSRTRWNGWAGASRSTTGSAPALWPPGMSRSPPR